MLKRFQGTYTVWKITDRRVSVWKTAIVLQNGRRRSGRNFVTRISVQRKLTVRRRFNVLTNYNTSYLIAQPVRDNLLSHKHVYYLSFPTTCRLQGHLHGYNEPTPEQQGYYTFNIKWYASR